MKNKRFYVAHSLVYGWTVYDRLTNEPAYDACAELLPRRILESGAIVSASPVMLVSETCAMFLAAKLNKTVRNASKGG